MELSGLGGWGVEALCHLVMHGSRQRPRPVEPALARGAYSPRLGFSVFPDTETDEKVLSETSKS